VKASRRQSVGAAIVRDAGSSRTAGDVSDASE